MWVLLLLAGCHREYRGAGGTDGDQELLSEKDTLATEVVEDQPGRWTRPRSIHIYIENSGSMNGYVEGQTEFKGAIRDLLVLLKYHYDEENIRIYFINSQVYETQIQTDLVNFASQLNTKTFRVGNTSSSNLNDIFNQVLSRTDESTLSILISDCIYSISSKHTRTYLDDQKTLTKDAFLSHSKKTGMELVTTVVKLNSTFRGRYYDQYDRPHLIGQLRPYYICVIGDDGVMSHFNSRVELNEGKISGFDKKYILTSRDYSPGSYYSVLMQSGKTGRFRPMRLLSAYDYVRGIEKVTPPRDKGPFRFTVAVNLSHIPVQEDYITDVGNYEVKEGNFNVCAVEAVDLKRLDPSDRVRVRDGGVTHLITLEAEKPPYTTVIFALKKQMPRWVYETEPDPDNVEYEEGKTFGFTYLMEGIDEAYGMISSRKDNYLEIKIPIEKGADHSWWIWLLIIPLAITAVVLIQLKRK